MRTAMAEILKGKIQEFLIREFESKLSLAEKAQIPVSILQRMMDGDGSAATFEFAYRILSIISPEDTRAILQKYYPFHVPEFEKDRDLVGNLKRVQYSLSFALKNRLSYQVHSMASNHHGTNEEEILSAFGPAGLRSLKDMIQAGVLIDSEDGRIIDPYLHSIQSNVPQLVQMIHYNLDIFDHEDPSSGVINIVEGFNEKGLNKLLAKFRSLWSEIYGISKDPTNWGSHRLYISGLMGPVAPSFSRMNYRKNAKEKNVNAEVIAELVHDIRRPLRDIVNFIEHPNHEAFSGEYLEQIKRSARRVDRMIESLRNSETSDLVVRRMGSFYLDPILDLCNQLSIDHGKSF
jgi:hypothetical protein